MTKSNKIILLILMIILIIFTIINLLARDIFWAVGNSFMCGLSLGVLLTSTIEGK